MPRISIVAAAFVLALVGGITTYTSRQATVSTEVAAAADRAIDPAAAPAAQQERDLAYQQRIRQADEQLRQANRQLELAYQKQAELAAQLDQANRQLGARAGGGATAQGPAYPVSPEQAAAVALALAPGAALTRAPELVDFQGMVAYEVALDRGTIYVDASSSQVLYDGVSDAMAGGGWGDEDEDHDHDYEEHGNDEHEFED